MQVQKTTIESLFTHERRYLIPLFQRPYVWTQDKQWEPLWEDIRDLAERELERAKEELPPDETVRPHFMGAIVLQPRLTYGDRLPVADVIDGQQRLTTLQVLLIALRDVAGSLGDAATTRWCRSRTENVNSQVDVDVERHKLWPTQRDQQQYLEVSNAGSRVALEERYPARLGRRKLVRPVMIEAYLYFHGAVEAWAKERGDGPGCTRAVKQALQRRLELVQIELDPSENPQEIFETLNARGVPLLASDLLRNFVFRRAQNPAQCEHLHAMYWTRFEVPDDPDRPEGMRFWEKEVRQGRLSRARLDLYLQHYLAMQLEREVRVGELFREYKDWIERAKPFTNVEAELREFVRYSDHFASLVVGDAQTSLGAFAARIAALDIQSAYPLIIGLLGEADLPESERSGIFTDLESFLVRRLVCGRPTTSYTRKFLELLREFRAARVFTRTSFQALLLRGDTHDPFDWPTDTQFETSWLGVDAYRVLKPARVEMILRALEQSMRSPLSEPVLLGKPLTVEHIMPQSWETHWPLPEGVNEDLAREQREEVVHDFGNLTLLTQALNSTLSNGPPVTKLTAITEHSNLQLSKKFRNRATWTEADIKARGRELATQALKIWPRPA
jgi:hypothetical protein